MSNKVLVFILLLQLTVSFGFNAQQQVSYEEDHKQHKKQWSIFQKLKSSKEKPHSKQSKPKMQFRTNIFKGKNFFYVVDKIIENKPTNVELILKLNSQIDANYVNNHVYQKLKVVINCNSWNELSLRITDLNESRFEVPHREPFPFTKNKNQSKPALFEFEFPQIGEKFYFKLIRKQTQEVIFDTSKNDFVFTDKYLEISTTMEQEKIYGMGDRRYTSFELGTGQFSFWAADATRIDYGMPNQQLYGHHPMYLRKESKSTNFHVVFLRNTYGMQADYIKNQKLTYKVIGGIFDFRFFIGDKYPETAIKMYHRYVNGYTLHPFWVQGFHQSRWGYNTTEKLVNVWKTFNKLNIPIDSLWSDIDYMQDYQDFTINTNIFDLKELKKIFNTQSPDGVHWSSIIDVGISTKSIGGQEGVNKKIFIMSNMTGQPLVGWVWPGAVNFPDFNHPNATQYWQDGFTNLAKYGLEQDGIWIDMNEFSNFVNGEIVNGYNPPSKIQTDYPFNPLGDDTPLDKGTLSLNATHYNGPDANLFDIPNYQITEYDMHNINGFAEGYTTYQVAKKMGKKLTFILSRSTLFGSGRYVQHWTGDNMSTWEYLKLSIGIIQQFQMFSIPLVGDDICGFNGDTNPELCARWFQVGSLYPFARDHNSINNIDQEPYAFPNYPYVLSSAKKVLQIRYQLLKFYYHLFVRGNGKGTVFRPLFFEFPEDQNTYQYEGQFMLGDYLMAAPVLRQGNNQTNSTFHTIYFPENSIFFNFYNYKIQQPGVINTQVSFDDNCPLYIRGGKIVHIQDSQYVVRSNQLNSPFTLMIALDNNEAKGQMMSISDYNDDENIVENCIEKNCIINIFASVQQQHSKSQKDSTDYTINITFTASTKKTIFQNIQFKKLIIVGLKSSTDQQISKVVELNEIMTVSKDNQTIQQKFTEKN